MSRDFNSTNKTNSTILRSGYRGKFNNYAYPEDSDDSNKSIKKINFYAR